MNQHLDVIALGKPYGPLIASGEGMSAHFDISGITIYITLQTPTETEINYFNEDFLKIAASSVDGVPVLSYISKMCGGWFDCALELECKAPEKLEEGNGFFTHIILADAITGTVVAMRSFTLSTVLSNRIVGILQTTDPISVKRIEDAEKIHVIQSKYTSEQVASMCPCIFTIGENPTEVKGF